MSNRREEIALYAREKSIEEASEIFGIAIDTVKKYVRMQGFNTKGGTIVTTELDKDLLALRERFTPQEIKAILRGGRVGQVALQSPQIEIHGDKVKFIVISDLHLGSLYTDPYHLELILKIIEEERPDFILIPGDITEGMSNRNGHIYELSAIGFEAQLSVAVEFFSQIKVPVYAVDGNHDRWYMKGQNIGADIVSAISRQVPNFHKIGSDVGDIIINGCVISLWHGEDGATYARSYRPQKIVETIPGGKKPNLLVTGHDHKEIFLTIRNIHVIGAGSVQQQTPFMRSKRREAHVGIWNIEMEIHEGRITRFKPEWIPFYA